MLTNNRERKICEKYSAYNEYGLVNCRKCPLVKGDWFFHDFRCKANSSYNRSTREWEYDLEEVESNGQTDRSE